MLKSSLTAIVMMAVSNFAFAQVDVVDSEPLGSPSAYPNSYPAARDSRGPKPVQAAAPDSYAQIQAMQEEIQELRGLVEQQSNELKRIKQQREFVRSTHRNRTRSRTRYQQRQQQLLTR